ncbi:MAG TPA: alpha/beta fold hydrolase [Nitrososphaeraceae archaeon]|nr:alpha/beta fold hydrolase [Nitrososphaeraceae archaeon]
MGETFLDWKCMQNDRLLYNDILEIRPRMRMFHYRRLDIALFFTFLFISAYVTDINLVIANSSQSQEFSYQTPLFSSLDDREVALAGSKTEAITSVLQNATISRITPIATAGQVLNDLSADSVNPSLTINQSENTGFYEPAVNSSSFKLENVTFRHYRDHVNGITMHYVMGGEGEPIVLLHGWPQTWYEWRKVMPILAENNFTVIVPDLRGLGDSSKPATGYDGNTTASDIYQLISGLDFSTIYLVGHDIGSQTAYSYTKAHPNNVSKLVVIDYVFPGLYSNATFPEPWWFAFHRTLDMPEALVAGNEREYLSWFYRQLAYNPYSVDESAINEYVMQYSAPGGMRSGFEYFREIPFNAKLNNETSGYVVDTPVLAVSGDYSPFRGGESVPNYSLESASQIAENVSTVIVPSSGHWIPEEQPKALADLILKFSNEKVQYPSSYATNTANAIEDLVRTIDNGSLLQPNITQTNNFTKALNPPTSGNASTAPVQNQGGEARNISISSVMESTGSNLTTGGELLTNQTSVPGNGSSAESTRNAEGLQVGEESVVDQGTPLSEAIEAISKLFGRNNGG